MTVTKKTINELPHRQAMTAGGIRNTHVMPKQFKEEIIALEAAYDECDEDDEDELKSLEKQSKAYGISILDYISDKKTSKEAKAKLKEDTLAAKQKADSDTRSEEEKRLADEAKEAVKAKKKKDAEDSAEEAKRLAEEAKEKAKTAVPLSKEQKIAIVIDFLKDKGQATLAELHEMGVKNAEESDTEITLDDNHKLIKNGDVFVLAEKDGEGNWALWVLGLAVTGILAFFGVRWYQNRKK